jgi:hypothetical protein
MRRFSGNGVKPRDLVILYESSRQTNGGSVPERVHSIIRNDTRVATALIRPVQARG